MLGPALISDLYDHNDTGSIGVFKYWRNLLGIASGALDI